MNISVHYLLDCVVSLSSTSLAPNCLGFTLINNAKKAVLYANVRQSILFQFSVSFTKLIPISITDYKHSTLCLTT